MIVFLSVIFPNNLVYFNDFLDSLNRQTFKEFSLILFNDGCEIEILKKYLNHFNIKFNIINVNSISPVQIRNLMINYVIENDIDIAVFGDTDDYFEENRIQVSIDKLKKFDIVVNELVLFKDKTILEKKYLSKRFSNNSVITLEDILKKNIFGLSNTAINCSIIKEINFDEDLIAVDWFLFSVFLLNNATAIFTNESYTYYRQHNENTVGLGNDNYETLASAIKVKKVHYKAMSKKDLKFNSFLSEIICLEAKIDNLVFPIRNKTNSHLLWWENTILIN
jgi:hypothetical protein